MRSGKPGTLGLVSYFVKEGKLILDDIMRWFEVDLAPLLGPFPGPRSVVVLDNMPQHRRMEDRFRAACAARGADAPFWSGTRQTHRT